MSTPPTASKDLVMLMLEIAWSAYGKGELSHSELVGVIKRCINVRAVENGYEAAHGLPCPEVDAKG